MSCTRACAIDLAAFRTEPGLAEFEDFARHYPTCGECSRAVAEWSRLEGALRASGTGEGHPSEARLLAFQDEPSTLEASVRQGIERHLRGCAGCRSELAVLRDFDLGALAPAAAAVDGPRGSRLRPALVRLAETLFGVPRPALVVALLIALAVPAAWLAWRATRGAEPTQDPPLAQRETPTPETLVAPEPEAPEIEMPQVLIGREPVREPPTPAAEPAGMPEPEASAVEVAATPAPEPSASPPPSAQPAPEPEPPPRTEPVRIAALLPSDLPRYRPDVGLSGDALASVRVASAVRSARAGALPRIVALAPEHRGATRLAAPILYWSLDADSDVPVELTLVAEDAAEPLLELRVASPRAGVHALPLAERGVELRPGTPYLWFASLVPDDDHRDLDVVSGAGIVRAPADAELARRLEQAPPERAAHVLAEGGYWYDAFATVEGWLAAEPDAPRLRAYRDALLRQVGLEPWP